jgi:ribosomal protein S18 acetylase RimI-like enzyme
MENLFSRPYNHRHDDVALTDLLLACRLAGDLRTYPTVWRTRLLLSSRVGDRERDTRLWFNADDKIVGFSMLWRRKVESPYLVLDRFLHPNCAGGALSRTMLSWGEQRARQIVVEEGTSLTVYIAAIHPDERPEEAGFSPVKVDPVNRNVYCCRSLEEAIPPPVLPPGFQIRALREVGDLAAYQSTYSFAAVSRAHLIEQLESQEYEHLVVLNPDGDFAAYCEYSVFYEEWQPGKDRIGWIDYVQTSSDYRRMGLGCAVLMAGLSHLREWGAETAMLITVSSNVPALSLYRKAGFMQVEVREAARFEKQLGIFARKHEYPVE